MIETNPEGAKLIAACGINCGVCRAHLRVNNPCPGCRADDRGKPKTRVRCRLKTCEKRSGSTAGYCFTCDEFPCADLVHLDTRYRVRYGLSPIDNLLSIKNDGIRKFIQNENEKWTCPACGAVLCMHEPQCLVCGYAWRS
ncbi:MAG TPA: DUF3795 domain-containing protein [Anaerolineales bacterium]